MPDESYKKYLEQARKNGELVFFLKKNCEKHLFFKWIFVAIYYTAYHYLCAFLAKRGESLPKIHGDWGDKEGDIKKSEKLITQKNGIIHAAVDDYKQLYQWSCDVRYKPEREGLLGRGELDTALISLMGVKLIVLNEIEYMPKLYKETGDIRIEQTNKEYLKKLYAEYKSCLSSKNACIKNMKL